MKGSWLLTIVAQFLLLWKQLIAGKQVQEILQRLESSKNEDEQLAALIELCQVN